MICRTIAAVIAVLVSACSVLTASALAEETTPTPSDQARYSFHKIADGFLRLDRETGEVALCGRQPVGWACLVAPEDRAVLEGEIARLHRENAALKDDLLSHGLSLPPGTMKEQPEAGDGRSVTLRLPDSADFDRVMHLVGQLWHHLVEVIANAQSQVLHRS
jgi:hypothetical protein